MFEVIATICAGAVCGPALVPGHETATRAACEAGLAEIHAPRIAGNVGHDLRCEPAGPVLDMDEIAPGTYVHTGSVAEWAPENRGDISNIVVMVGTASVAIIDAGSARWMGEALWRTVRRISDLPLGHVVLTHMHPDHTLGAEVLSRAGARVVGHEALERALQDRRETYLTSLALILGPDVALGTDIPEIDVAVADRHAIDLGGRTLDLRAWTSGHTGADLSVEDPAAGLFVAGDLVFDTHLPALDGSLLGWQAHTAELAARDFDIVVPGHGDVLHDWPEGVAPQARYLDTLAEDIRAAIADGARLGEVAEDAARSEADEWALFSVHNARNATVAFTELEWE